MRDRHTRHFVLLNSDGVTLVLVAILMAMLIGFAALAVDIGYIATTRNELQNISDASALAAAGKLGEIYMNNGSYNHDTDHTLIESIAIEVGQKNQAAGLPIVIAVSDVEIGSWNADPGASPRFTSNTVDPDAVRVTVGRTDDLNGNISTFFDRIFDEDSVAVMADAVAALTGPAEMDPGVLKLPVGLSENQFPDNCKEPITFGDTLDSCAGWHIFDEDKVNANDLDAMIVGMIVAYEPDGPDDPDDPDDLLNGLEWLEKYYPDMNKVPAEYVSPGVTSGETIFNFQGGTIASLFNSDAKNPAPIEVLFEFWKTRDDDDDDAVWLTTVPVYADGVPCENPTGELLIKGQADIIVTQINGPPENSIDAVIDCSYKALRGGGGSGGNKGAIPNLVE